MAKPVTEPRWVATGNTTAPSTPKQNAGWAAGERPGAQHLNWLFYWIWTWITYLKNFGDHAQVFTEAVTFDYDQATVIDIQHNVTVSQSTGGAGITVGQASVVFSGSTSVLTLFVPLHNIVGYKPTKVKLFGSGGSGTTETQWEAKIVIEDPNAGPSTVDTETINPITAGYFEHTFTVTGAPELAAGQMFRMELKSTKNSTNQGGSFLGACVTYTKESYTP